jgi:site-specific recombinase XerD
VRSFEEGFAAWEERLESYRAHLRRRYRNRRPKKSCYGIEKFWSWLAERQIVPDELEPAHFGVYCRDLESGRLCKAAEAYTPRVLGYFRWQALLWTRHLFREGQLVLDPFAELSPNFGRRRFSKEALSIDQVRELLNAPDGSSPQGLRDRAILEVAYGSGLRLGELAELGLGSLDLGEQTLILRNTKSGWDRVVPLTRPACAALERYLTDGRHHMSGPLAGSALWLSSRYRQMSYLSFDEIPKRCRRQLGFGFTMHQLRHACATHLLEGGARLPDIARLLGHESLESTEIYARARLEELRRVHAEYHPRG